EQSGGRTTPYHLACMLLRAASTFARRAPRRTAYPRAPIDLLRNRLGITSSRLETGHAATYSAHCKPPASALSDPGAWRDRSPDGPDGGPADRPPDRRQPRLDDARHGARAANSIRRAIHRHRAVITRRFHHRICAAGLGSGRTRASAAFE